MYTDSSECGKACEELSWNHCTSTPHRSETNGISERAVRRMKEGTSAVLLQSGLDEKWCADSMECNCYLRSIQELLSDGKTPYERRFGIPFNGPVILFGALVEYHTISAKDVSRSHQFGPKVLGDTLVAEIEELEQMDASEIHARRLNAKEVLTPMKNDKFVFPVADGTVKTSGGDRRLERPERGEAQEVFRGESDELSSPTPRQADSTRDDAEAKSDFWSITGDFIYRHHVEPRVKLYSPREESFPIPMKYIDFTRTTRTSLDVLLKKQIDDHWNVDGERKLSDSWTGFTRFVPLKERPPEGYTWSGRRLTRKQTTSRSDNIWPDMWKHMSDASSAKHA